jgi:glucose/arabinose dehydrogenase
MKKHGTIKTKGRGTSKRSMTLFAFLAVVLLLSGCEVFEEIDDEIKKPPGNPSDQFPAIQLPDGYQIEKVADKLTYPTSVTWDDEGRMYVAEAGGAFLDEPAPARILRMETNGEMTVIVADLEARGIYPSISGMVWHEGAIYFTHRANDLTGAVSRMTPDGGSITELFRGFIDSQTDHQLNGIRVGPDGRMYFASGIGGNSAVMGQDMTPFVVKNPETAQATSAKDIVLTGRNFKIPNYLTMDVFGDTVLTGAFVPFGTPTHPGQVIEGREKPGGAIMVFDPADPEGTLEMYAWGMRNVIGFAWNKQGEMFATQNGYDVAAGGRPIKDLYDPTYRVRQGAWYGVPDFSAALEPVTDPKFQPPGELLPPVFIDGVKQEKRLGFVIDHEASGLTPPDKSLIAGLHPVNSSPSKPDVAPDSWGDMAGRLFVPEWGDMAWFTNPLRDHPVGNRIVSINPTTGAVEPFIHNAQPGPASEQGALGLGLERPYDVKFGPDDAMYIVDYGQHLIVLRHIEHGHFPFEWPERTGAIWKVTKTSLEASTK